MEKDFWNLKSEQKKMYMIIFCAGFFLTILLAIKAFGDTKLINDYEICKNEVGKGAYEQELIAIVGEEKIPLTIEIGERQISKEEAQTILQAAEAALDDTLKGNNISLSKITTDVNFADAVPGMPVTVEWTEKASDYFDSGGTLREHLMFSEPVEQSVSAVLSCQAYTRDYEALLTIWPAEVSAEGELLEQVKQSLEKNPQNLRIALPKEYKGNQIIWKKPLDYTFLYFGFLTIAAIIFLAAGGKRDERLKRQERLESLEQDYAQIVSKFTMLLAAGLSLRNAWERIVVLQKEDHRPVYEEMNWAVRQMQQGVSELEVYEKFGNRTGQVHYKKLMALFIMERKRGGISLLEEMNREMLQAFEEQKRKTRQQGEKTGTKLLIPMMGMLMVVFIMIIVPAFLSFQL